MSIQTWMHLFILLNTKEDHLKNADKYIYIFFFLHTMDVYGNQNQHFSCQFSSKYSILLHAVFLSGLSL